MCGIFGAVSIDGRFLSQGELEAVFFSARKAQRRGSDASGITVLKGDGSLFVIKGNSSISELLKAVRNPKITDEYLVSLFDECMAVFGHSRLETHGSSSVQGNNQPTNYEGWTVVHNGIITNSSEILSGIPLPGDLDTFAINKVLSDLGDDRIELSDLVGEYSFAALSDSGRFLLATNVGNIYSYSNAGVMHFASERRQFKTLDYAVRQLPPGSIFETTLAPISRTTVRAVDVSKQISSDSFGSTEIDAAELEALKVRIRGIDVKLENKHRDIFRCKRCVLPSSFPGLTFDADGVCQFCKSHKEPNFEGISKMVKDLSEISPDNRTVLVCLSGGRDSCYILHLLVELGFNCIAYTYDWGVVTNAARENMARICGKLGVEHVLVSPNIPLNRARIQRTLKGWLKYPSLATVPLLMAGDKPYFRFSAIVSRERGGIPAVMADHAIESTGFKSILAGARPEFNEEGGVDYRLTLPNLVRMAFGYLRGCIKSPYLLRSFFTEGALGFKDYYLMKHEFFRPFEYFAWDEKLVEDVLREEYGWSTGREDSVSSWRMGDGTAPFYNFVYKLGLGFTEHDALRANQVRHGLLSREKALEVLLQDNVVDGVGVVNYLLSLGIDVEIALNQLEKKFVSLT